MGARRGEEVGGGGLANAGMGEDRVRLDHLRRSHGAPHHLHQAPILTPLNPLARAPPSSSILHAA
eukprot:1484376-Pyramimonas_sp.AAC.1